MGRAAAKSVASERVRVDASTLIEKQSQGLQSGLADEVYFLIEGLSDASMAGDSMLRALELCMSKQNRSAMKEAGVFRDLLVSAVAVPWKSDATHQCAALACTYVLLMYCSGEFNALVRNASAAACGVDASQLCASACSFLERKAYSRALLSAEHARSLDFILKHCKVMQYIPQEFRHCPQAVVLVALRMACDGSANPAALEQLKRCAAPSKLLHHLASLLAENLAVLTGRQPASFTERTNDCMWYAHTSLATLEALTAAQPANCEALAALAVPFGGVRAVLVPRVLVAALVFSRNERLAASKATHLCLACALQLLVNLTNDSRAGCRSVLKAGGVEATAAYLVWLCCHDAPMHGGSAGRRTGGQSVVPLPDAHNVLPAVPEAPALQPETGVGAVATPPITVAAVRAGQQLLTSALCVLTNMAERDTGLARYLAVMCYSGNGFDRVRGRGQGSRHASPMAACQMAARQPQGGAAQEDSGPGNAEAAEDGAARRLATGSRRKRHAASVLAAGTGTEAKGAAGAPRDRAGAARRQRDEKAQTAAAVAAADVPTCDSAAHCESAVDATMSQAVDGLVRRAAANNLQCTFLRFLCEAIPVLWADADASRRRPRHHKATRPSLEAADSGVESRFVQLYMAILLGFLVRACPELRAHVGGCLPIARLAEDLQDALGFYTEHAAMEAHSITSLEAVIRDLVA